MTEAEKQLFLEEVATIRGKIKQTLETEYTKGCLVKMNWSSTVDAEFMCATINCFTADEVFLQLKASQAIGEDITRPFGLDEAQMRTLKADK